MEKDPNVQKALDAQDTLAIIQRYSDVELKKAGVDWKGPCPFHQERTASFVVNERRNRYKCFGCGASGDGINFLMEHRNLSFMDAVKEVAAMEGIDLGDGVPQGRLQVVREKVDRSTKLSAAELEALAAKRAKALANMLYHLRKADRTEATAYLQGRGIDTDALPSGAFYGSAAWASKDGNASQPAGVAFVAEGDRLINKRYFTAGQHGEKSYNKGEVPNSFYTATLRNTADVWLTEGVINALSIYQTRRSAVATFATSNNYSDTAAVGWMKGRNVVLAADGDRAGQLYILKQSVWLHENRETIGFKGLYAFIFPDPEKDANDHLQEGDLDALLANRYHWVALTQAAVQRAQEEGQAAADAHATIVAKLRAEGVPSADLPRNTWQPTWGERLGLDGWEANKGRIMAEHVAVLRNNFKQPREADELVYYPGNYAAFETLLRAKVRKVRIAERMTRIFEPSSNTVETDYVGAAKWLVARGITVMVQPGDNWSSATDDETDYYGDSFADSVSFVAYYPHMLHSAVASFDSELRSVMIGRSADFLASLDEAMYTVEYAKVAKMWGLSKGDWNAIAKPHLARQRGRRKADEMVANSSEETDFSQFDVNDLPSYVDKSEFYKNQFFELRNRDGKPVRYMMQVKGESLVSVSNFTMKVMGHLFHHESGRNKRIVQLTNKVGIQSFVEVESSVMRSKDKFGDAIFNNGNLIFSGTKAQYERILEVVNDNIPKWYELDTLGQQPEGVYAFEDGLYDYRNRQFLPVSDIGTVEFGERVFYSPNQSSIGHEIRGRKRDEHAGQMLFHKGPDDQQANFARWAWLMDRVFPEEHTGKFALLYVAMAAQREFIYRRLNHFPLYFMYGDTNAGKSQVAQSIVAPFTGGMKFNNLNSDTDAAFFVMLEKFRNVPVVFDEYEENKISPVKFQGLKAAYDGIGKTKKKDASSNHLDISEVNCAPVFLGQYAPEQDDYALFNRSLCFYVRKRDFTQEDTRAFEELREMEARGVTNIITSFLDHRPGFERKWPAYQASIKDRLKREAQAQGSEFVERILNTVSEFLATAQYYIADAQLELPYDYETIHSIGFDKLISLSAQILRSNKKAQFFNTIEYLVAQKRLVEGREYKIEEVTKVRLRTKKGDTQHVFEQPTKVLFLRMKLITEEYLRVAKQDALKPSTLQSYLENHSAYVGNAINQVFEHFEYTAITQPDGTVREQMAPNVTRNTTALAFLYNPLGMELETSIGQPVPQLHDPGTTPPDAPMPTDDLPF